MSSKSKHNLSWFGSILDVGCGPDGRSLEKFLHSDYRIVGIDLYDETEVKVNHPRFTYFQQEARSLSRFRDKEFDLALSIGMMEHICDRTTLSQMACEINRLSNPEWQRIFVGSKVYVTPTLETITIIKSKQVHA